MDSTFISTAAIAAAPTAAMAIGLMSEIISWKLRLFVATAGSTIPAIRIADKAAA